MESSARAKSSERCSSIARSASSSRARTAAPASSSPGSALTNARWRTRNACTALRTSRSFFSRSTLRRQAGSTRLCACSNWASPSSTFAANARAATRTGSDRPGRARNNPASGQRAIAPSAIAVAQVSASMARLSRNTSRVYSALTYSRYIRSPASCLTPCSRKSEIASMSATSAACAASMLPRMPPASPAGGSQPNGGSASAASAVANAATASSRHRKGPGSGLACIHISMRAIAPGGSIRQALVRARAALGVVPRDVVDREEPRCCRCVSRTAAAGLDPERGQRRAAVREPIPPGALVAGRAQGIQADAAGARTQRAREGSRTRKPTRWATRISA